MIQFLLPFGLVALALAGSGGAESAPAASPSSPLTSQGGAGISWHTGRAGKLTMSQRKENFQAVYRMGKALEDAGLFGPGFAEWLTVVSYTEAMGNPAAGSDSFSNKARGMYGLRPTTAWNEAAKKDGKARVWNEASAELAFANGEVTGEEVAALKDLAWSTALAAHNVSRLRRYLQPEQPYTMLGARRGWAFPNLVDDYANTQRPELLERWNEALGFFGLPANFGEQRMRVLVPRPDFPHPATIHGILLQAIEGEDVTGQNQPGFIVGSIETGEHNPGTGRTYAWALGEQLAGPWSWAVDQYAQTPEPIANYAGETPSRNQAAQAIIDTIEGLESSS